MTKLFALYGLLCFLDPSADSGQRCMNFWEEPIQHYTRKQCAERSFIKGREIELNFKNRGLLIHELKIWCIPTKEEKL